MSAVLKPAARQPATGGPDRCSPVEEGSVLHRQGINRRLSGLPAGGLCLVVAAAGFGKSTALLPLVDGGGWMWHTCRRRDASREGLLDAVLHSYSTMTGQPATLEDLLADQATLVLDDADELGPCGSGVDLLASIVRERERSLRVIVVSRRRLSFLPTPVRRHEGYIEIDADDLAFSLEEIDVLLEQTLGRSTLDLATPLHRATGGWPAAVVAVANRLAELGPDHRFVALERMLQCNGPLDRLTSDWVADLEAEDRETLGQLVPLRVFTPELVGAAGILRDSQVDPAPDIADLARRGIFLRPPGADTDDLQVAPLLRTYFARRRNAVPVAWPTRQCAAATWLRQEGRVGDALEAFMDARATDAMVDLLLCEGDALIRVGEGQTVLTATETVCLVKGDQRLTLLLADAHVVCGHGDEAERLYMSLDDGGLLPSGLAWRLGSLRHLRGQLGQAMSTYSRGNGSDDPMRDRAMLHAWEASTRFRTGDEPGCTAAARQAFALATAGDDEATIAAAHLAMALSAALRGNPDTNHHHYLMALDAATNAGDVLQRIRIHTNLGSALLEQGLHEESIEQSSEAIDLAESSGIPWFLTTAYANRSQAERHLGRLEESLGDIGCAAAVARRLGSPDISYSLLEQAELHRAMGRRALARGAFRSAIAAAEPVGDVQVLRQALTGLSWALRDEDGSAALDAANRAVDLSQGVVNRPEALAALGFAQLALGRHDAARATARQSLDEAAGIRDRRATAQALELQAAIDPLASKSDGLLQEACDLWRDMDCPRGLARCLLALARRAVGLERQMLALEAADLFRSLGVRISAVAAESLAKGSSDPPVIEIQTLGGFAVFRAGKPIELSEWGSRKARDLLKMLVARHGHPASREQLAMALWPDENERGASRLSVQLSTLRSVLDPTRSKPIDHFIRTGGNMVWLDTRSFDIDVETFIKLARTALDHPDLGNGALTALLTKAEAAYTGEFLEAELSEEWTGAVREESRAAYIEVARRLASLHGSSGRPDAAARLYRRIIDHDPFDEPAHLALVAELSGAGRHGEARRSYVAYEVAMTEIGVRPRPSSIHTQRP